jgi:hypothetical protein
MSRRIRWGVGPVVLVAFLLTPGAVSAGPIVGMGGTFTVGGITGGVGGAFELHSLARDGRELVASGHAIYSLCIPGVDPKNCLATIEQDLSFPVAAVDASCDTVTVSFAPFELVSPPSLAGFTLDMQADPITADASTAAVRPSLFCSLGHRAAGSAPPGSMLGALDAVFGLPS